MESNLRQGVTPLPPALGIISLIKANVTPIAYLEIGRAMIEQFQHVPDILRILNHEVQLHVEFAAHQLRTKQADRHSIRCHLLESLGRVFEL